VKPSATDISLKYLGALTEAVRKKNASKYAKATVGNEEAVSTGSMGENAELGDDDLSSILESQSGENEMGEESAENEMGDGFTGDGKDAGDPSATPADDKDQATEESPTMALFKKKSKPLFKG
jgi:hypothetical protein